MLKNQNAVVCAAMWVAAAAPLSLSAQELNKARFLPNNYEAEVRIHVGELTNIGLVDELRKSPFWTMVKRSLIPMDFRADEIEWCTFVPEIKPEKDSFCVFEGTPKMVRLPSPDSALDRAQAKGWLTLTHEEFAGRPVVLERWRWRNQGAREDHLMWVSPEPGVVVFGPRIALEKALAGDTKNGVPSMQVLELRGHRALVSAIHSLDAGDIDDLVELLESKGWVSESNPLERVAIRLIEAEEERFELHAVCRFRKAGKEPEALARAFRFRHAALLNRPQFRIIRPSLDRVLIEASGLDTVLSLPIGDTDALLALVNKAMLLQLGVAMQQSWNF